MFYREFVLLIREMANLAGQIKAEAETVPGVEMSGVQYASVRLLTLNNLLKRLNAWQEMLSAALNPVKTKTPIEVHVDQQSVVVNQVHVKHVGPETIVIEVDCATKYPEVLCTSDDGEISLIPRTDEGACQATVLHFKLPDPGSWDAHLNTGRYSVDIVFVRKNLEGDIIFQRDLD